MKNLTISEKIKLSFYIIIGVSVLLFVLTIIYIFIIRPSVNKNAYLNCLNEADTAYTDSIKKIEDNNKFETAFDRFKYEVTNSNLFDIKTAKEQCNLKYK